MQQRVLSLLTSIFLLSCGADYGVTTPHQEDTNITTQVIDENSSKQVIDENSSKQVIDENSSKAPSPENPPTGPSKPGDEDLPEFIFKVDLGKSGKGEPFWYAWEEDGKAIKSSREVFPVFDQNPLKMKIEGCFEFNREDDSSQSEVHCAHRHKILHFSDRGDISNTDLPSVLSDGVLAHTNVALTLDPLPIGKYEMKLYFHDALAKKQGKFEIFVDEPAGRKSLGTFTVSKGKDASNPTVALFRFNVLSPRPLKLYFRCIHARYIINGFELTKFFETP